METDLLSREGLPRQLLEDVLEAELLKQYRLSRGEKSKYMPVSDGVRYLCDCGEEGPVGECCEACGLPQQPLTRQVLEKLRQEAEERLAYEAANADVLEQQRREEAEKEEKKKKRQRWLRILAWIGVSLAALALLVGAVWLTVEVIVPAVHYANAQKALEEGDFQRAHLQFTLAGDYRDAEEYLSRFFVPVSKLVTTTIYQQTTMVYTYDPRGRPLTVTLTEGIPDLSGGYRNGTPEVFVNSYDGEGRQLERHDAYGRTVYTYNDHGDVVRELEYRHDGVHDSTSLFVYEYDEAGRIVLRSEICSEHVSVNYSFEQTDTFLYDDRGRLVIQTTTANYPASMEGNFEAITHFAYDTQDRVVQTRETVISPNDPMGSCEVVYSWEYDGEGRVIRTERSSTYPQDESRNSRQIITTVYNDRGEITEQITRELFPGDPSRDSVSSQTVRYDNEGRVTEKNTILRYTDPMRQSRSGYSQLVVYSYDWLGRLERQEETWTEEEPAECYVQEIVFSYGWGRIPKSCTRTTLWQEEQEQQVVKISYNENGGEAVVEELGEKEDAITYRYWYAYIYIPPEEEMPEAIIYEAYH